MNSEKQRNRSSGALACDSRPVAPARNVRLWPLKAHSTKNNHSSICLYRLPRRERNQRSAGRACQQCRHLSQLLCRAKRATAARRLRSLSPLLKTSFRAGRDQLPASAILLFLPTQCELCRAVLQRFRSLQAHPATRSSRAAMMRPEQVYCMLECTEAEGCAGPTRLSCC